MRKAIMSVVLFGGLCFGQTAGFVNNRYQINKADEWVRGITNFTGTGQVARFYLGDLNHALTAKYGSGLSVSVYRAPNAMFIQDITGNVFLPAMVSTGPLFVSTPLSYDFSKPAFQVYSASEGAISFSVDGNGHASLGGGCPFCASLGVNGSVSAPMVFADSVDMRKPSGGPNGYGIYFQDGTNQNTAAGPPPLKATTTVPARYYPGGTCYAATVTVPGATTSMAAVASSAGDDQNDRFYVKAYVGGADVVVIKACALVSQSSVAATYNIRVIP